MGEANRRLAHLQRGVAAAHDALHRGDVDAAHEALHRALHGDPVALAGVRLHSMLDFDRRFVELAHRAPTELVCWVALVPSETHPGAASLQTGGSAVLCRLLGEHALRHLRDALGSPPEGT